MKIDFNNTEIAFSSKNNSDLKKAYILFKTIGNPKLVKTGSKALNLAFNVHFPINWIVKPTIYNHFVGGENIESCYNVIRKLEQYNIKAILDYSVEGKENKEDIKLAFEETLRAIKNAGKDSNIPFAVFKPTAMGRSVILEKASSNMKMTEEEKVEELEFRNRIHELCKTAYELNTPILIDAEHSYYQNIIDDATYNEMLLYNKEKAIVWNTFQMYRHDRLVYLKKLYEKSVSENFFLGAKFVRGAYMEIERERAKEKGYEDPIQPNKQATDDAFNEALKFTLEHIDRISIFNGTHNEESTQFMIDEMEKLNIKASDERCWFSQLYGMSDNISFNVGKAGFNVAKYLPYGPIKHVLPYLLRRAEENTSSQGQSGRELKLIVEEMNRRKSVNKN